MSRITNYTTNTTKLSRTYTKYMVSRIMTNSLSDLLETEIPTNIPDNFFAEIHLYSLADNVLVYSDTLYNDSQSEIFKVTTLQYPDNSIRRLILINFSKIPTPLPDGRFEVVINFFVPEIGNPTDTPLSLTRISPSRLEVELQLSPTYRTIDSASQLVTFASPQINSTWVLEALKYICNQTQSLNPNIPTEKTILSFDIIQEFLPTSQQVKLNGTNIDGIYTASVKTSTQKILNTMYNYASQSIEQRLSTQERFTNTVLNEIVSSSLGKAMMEYNQVPNFTLV
jgi:hypothetical protein